MISSRELAKSLIQLVEESGDHEKSVDAFMKYLEDNKLSVNLPQIKQHLERMAREDKEFNTLVIETPYELTKTLVSDIQKRLDAKSDVEIKENPNLIGGFKALYRGKILDTSISTQLRNLRESLKN